MAESSEFGVGQRPNVVVFVSDDQGYGDLSCMGSRDVRTPNIDKLAADGARLTSWYTNSPVCSPSRASFLTGRYPGNAGIRSILHGYRTTPGLRPEVPTVATALRQEGYSTALFGKWHLGLDEASRPENHGFDRTFGHLSGAIDYYSHIHYSPNNREIIIDGSRHIGTPLHDLWADGSEVYMDGEYMTSLIADRAAAYVDEACNFSSPFFMYVPFNAPHHPMHAPEMYKRRFAHLPWARMIMAAMISAMDDAVGAVVKALERRNVYDNTLIVFMSDNGPSREIRNWLNGSQDPYYGGDAGGLKGHKFSLFEGGIRVPGIISWPAIIPANQVIDEPLVAMDVFPTVLAACGGDAAAYELDGTDILEVLTGGAVSPHEYIFWEQGGQTAVRKGNWKLVLNGQLEENAGPVDDIFLADLQRDPGEEINLRESCADVVADMEDAAIKWRRGIEQRWATEWLPHLPDYASYVHTSSIIR